MEAAAGALLLPNADPMEEPPKGLGAAPNVFPPKALPEVELKGDLDGACVDAVPKAPKGDLLSPPPTPKEVLDVGAVVEVDETGAASGAVEVNGD